MLLLLLTGPDQKARAVELRIRLMREFHGDRGVRAFFRPVRKDALFEAAQAGGALAHRVLAGEGVVRSLLAVEYEVAGDHINVIGRSAELLFALVVITAKWTASEAYPAIAATGIVACDGAVEGVERIADKLAAAAQAMAACASGVIFYPAANVEDASRSAIDLPPHVQLYPVEHIDQALEYLGISLEKVYLGNPFRGLESFDYRHRAVFFGRDAEVAMLVDRLLSREAAGVPGMLVVGASGCGKSSFLRAGVLPRLAEPALDKPESLRQRPVSRGLRYAIWRPSSLAAATDEAALVDSLLTCWSQLPELKTNEHWLAAQPHALAELATMLLGHWPADRRFVWLIDQLEELFGLDLPGALLECFGAFLQQLQSQGIWTLATLRDDFLGRFVRNEPLRATFDSAQGHFHLGTLNHTAMEEAITAPAKAADLVYETLPSGERLDRTLKEDVFGERAPLPLLEFTLSQLYQHRDGQTLTYCEYRQLGGLRGAVAASAEEAIRQFTRAQRSMLFAALGRLARVDNQLSADRAKAYTRAVASWADFSGDEQGLLEPLVSARLLVKSSSPGQVGATIELAHDTMLTSWRELSEWLDGHRDALKWKQDFLEPWLRAWQKEPTAKNLLVPRMLKQAERLASSGLSIAAAEGAYLQCCARATRRRRLLQVGVSAALLVALSTSIGDYFYHAQEAANDALASQFVERGWSAIAKDRWPEAIRYALTAARFSSDDDRIVRPLLATLTFRWARMRQVTQTEPVASIALSGYGTRLLTATSDIWHANSIRMWSTGTGAQLSHFRVPADLTSVALSPDGRWVMTTTIAGAQLWNAATGRLVKAFGRGTFAGRSAFSPNSALAVLYTVHHGAMVVAVPSGRDIGRFGNGFVGYAEFSRSANRFITGAAGSDVATVWDIPTHRKVFSEAIGTSLPGEIELSEDGSVLLARVFGIHIDHEEKSFTGGIAWNVNKESQPLAVAAAYLAALAMSPDGRLLAVQSLMSGRSGDCKVTITDLPPDPATYPHSRIVLRDCAQKLRFVSHGRGLAAVFNDGSTRLFSVATGRQLAQSAPSGRALADGIYGSGEALISESGSYVAELPAAPVGKQSHSITVLDFSRARPIASLSTHSLVDSASFTTDGRRIEVLSDIKGVEVFDGRSYKELPGVRKWFLAMARSKTHLRVLAVSTDGRRAFVVPDHGPAYVLSTLQGTSTPIGPAVPRLSGASFSHSGSLVALRGGDTCRIISARTGAWTGRQFRQIGELSACFFSPNDRLVLTVSTDGAARVWNLGSGRNIARFKGEAGVDYAEFSPDGSRILIVAAQRTRLWRLGRAQPLATFGIGLQIAHFSPSGRRIVGVSASDDIRVWNVGARLPSLNIDLFGTGPVVNDAHFSDDGRYLLLTGGNLVVLSDAASGHTLLQLPTNLLGFAGADFASSGTRVLTYTDLGGVTIWDVSALQQSSKSLAAGLCASDVPFAREYPAGDITNDPLLRSAFLKGNVRRSVCARPLSRLAVTRTAK